VSVFATTPHKHTQILSRAPETVVAAIEDVIDESRWLGESPSPTQLDTVAPTRSRTGGPMADQSFAAALNEQISNEFAAHQQYIGAAVYYESETLPRLAAFFYRQAVEERNHAMMMVQYLLEASEEVRIPDIESKLTRFDDVVAPVRMALDQEKRVTDEINALFKLARETDDFQAEQFMQWFVKEQVEEVATMIDLLTVIERSADSPLLVEEYLAREGLGEEGADPTAPPAAGGAL
jgi:ferritin